MKKALLKTLLTKAGLLASDDFKELLAGDDNAEIVVSDALGQKIADNLINPTDALQLPSVENHFKGTLYGKTDGKVKEILKIKGYSDDEIKALIDGKSAEDKIAVAIDAIEKKIVGGTKKDATERETLLAKKYDDLKVENDRAIADANKKYQDLEAQYNGFKQKTAFGSRLQKFNLINIDPELRSEMAIKAIERDAQKLGAVVFITENGEIELRDKNDPTKQFFPETSPTTALRFEDFAPKALEAAGLLDKQGRAGSTPPGGAGNPGVTPPGAGSSGGAGTDPNTAGSMGALISGLRDQGVNV